MKEKEIFIYKSFNGEKWKKKKFSSIRVSMGKNLRNIYFLCNQQTFFVWKIEWKSYKKIIFSYMTGIDRDVNMWWTCANGLPIQLFHHLMMLSKWRYLENVFLIISVHYLLPLVSCLLSPPTVSAYAHRGFSTG